MAPYIQTRQRNHRRHLLQKHSVASFQFAIMHRELVKYITCGIGKRNILGRDRIPTGSDAVDEYRLRTLSIQYEIKMSQAAANALYIDISAYVP